MSQSDESDDEDFKSSYAKFTPSFALLDLAPLELDRDGRDAIHEMAHAQTFAGSDFYGEYVARILKGEKISIAPLAPLVEAIPEVFGKQVVGARHSPGSDPNPRIVSSFTNCVTVYREIFDKLWLAAGVNPDGSGGPAAHAAELPGGQIFGRTLVLEIARAALELSIVGKERQSPEIYIAKLEERLLQRRDLYIPTVGMLLADHIKSLMGYPQRDFIDMFRDHIRLADVLLHAESDVLYERVALLPALVGMEFFLQIWPPDVRVVFFASGTADHELRCQRYLHRRLRPPHAKAILAKWLDALTFSFNPFHGDLPIFPGNLRDHRAHNVCNLMNLPEFIRQLSRCLGWMVMEAPFPMESVLNRLQQLELNAERAAETYLSAVEKRVREKGAAADGAYLLRTGKPLPRPTLSNLKETFTLGSGSDAIGVDALYINPGIPKEGEQWHQLRQR